MAKKAKLRKREKFFLRCKDIVWSLAAHAEGLDPNEWREDSLGNPIRYDDYNNPSSRYGWGITHIFSPLSGAPWTVENMQVVNLPFSRIGGLA